MKRSDFNQNRLRQLIAEALDGQLDEAGRRALNETLESSAQARRYYRELMDLHARLHLEYTGGREAEFMPGSPQGLREKPHPSRPRLWLAAAAAVALLAVFSWRGAGDPQPFATLETAHSARWGSGDLPTREGSRLGAGKLRIEEGLAVIRFDSGAEVSLEAPAELMIVDAMNCAITHGTAVANVPDSAIGFRIGTPSAMVIDHGTRFAVSVDAASGGTRTQVFEGRVDVANPTTGEVVSLKTGQRNSVEGRQTGPVTEGFDERFQAGLPEIVPRSADWSLLESSKDAYTGYILETDSDQLLYVKHGQKGFHRKTYLCFDLAGIEAVRIDSAELMLQFEPTGLGLASHVPDATFSVYGLMHSDVPWDEDELRPYNAPANIEETGTGLVANEVLKLGSFVITQGVQRGNFGIASEALVDFLRERAGSEVTLIVVRETAETGETGLVHGIASRRHPTLPGPTLAIRLRHE
jgi:hypothetical protein